MLHEFNPAIVATGYFQQVDHKCTGRHQYGSLPIRIDAYPRINRVRPMLREDTHYILLRFLVWTLTKDLSPNPRSALRRYQSTIPQQSPPTPTPSI
jgi:hypothetical protein